MSEVVELPKAGELPEGYIGAGVHLVKIREIKIAKDKNGNPVVSKAGDPAYTFVFASKPTAENPKGCKLEQNFYTGKSQYFMDKYIQATGADNSNGPVSLNDVINRPLWIAVRNKITRVNGVIETNKEGRPVQYAEAFDAFKYFQGGEAPVVSKELLTTYYEKPTAQMPAIPKPTAPAPSENKTFAEVQAEYPTPWDDKPTGAIPINKDEPGW